MQENFISQKLTLLFPSVVRVQDNCSCSVLAKVSIYLHIEDIAQNAFNMSFFNDLSHDSLPKINSISAWQALTLGGSFV